MRKVKGVKSQDSATYTVTRDNADKKIDDAIIAQALAIIEKRWSYHDDVNPVTNPERVKAYLRLKLAGRDSEGFGVMFMDNRHRVIAFDIMFNGTIDGASVYPREVVKAALHHNASAVIFAHNHPSGEPEPSMTDRVITNKLREALALVDIRVLDHIVVGKGEPVSFAERGYV